MKSLKKKIREIKRNSNFKVLLLTVAMISSLFMFTMMLGIPTQIQSDSEETGNEPKTPTMSAPDWVSATKIWYAGTQSGSYNENNLRTNNGVSDTSNFVIDDSSQSWHTDYATTITSKRGLLWGTAFPRTVSGNVYNGLKNNDGFNLFLEADYLGGYTPGWIHLQWGYYPAPSPGIRYATYRIRIGWEIMCEAGWAPNILNQGHSLTLTAYCDNGAAQTLLITSGCPVELRKYSGVWSITSGPVFDRVKAGGYIRQMRMQMYNGEGDFFNWAISWMNCDYIDIYYDYYDYKVDFYYDLDFGGYSLGTVTKFDLKIDLAETVAGLRLYLYDFVTSVWDLKTYLDTAGMKILTVD